MDKRKIKKWVIVLLMTMSVAGGLAVFLNSSTNLFKGDLVSSNSTPLSVTISNSNFSSTHATSDMPKDAVDQSVVVISIANSNTTAVGVYKIKLYFVPSADAIGEDLIKDVKLFNGVTTTASPVGDTVRITKDDSTTPEFYAEWILPAYLKIPANSTVNISVKASAKSTAVIGNSFHFEIKNDSITEENGTPATLSSSPIAAVTFKIIESRLKTVCAILQRDSIGSATWSDNNNTCAFNGTTYTTLSTLSAAVKLSNPAALPQILMEMLLANADQGLILMPDTSDTQAINVEQGATGTAIGSFGLLNNSDSPVTISAINLTYYWIDGDATILPFKWITNLKLYDSTATSITGISNFIGIIKPITGAPYAKWTYTDNALNLKIDPKGVKKIVIKADFEADAPADKSSHFVLNKDSIITEDSTPVGSFLTEFPTKIFKVVAPTAAAPDLTVESFKLDPASQTADGSVSFSAVIKNIGNADAGQSVTGGSFKNTSTNASLPMTGIPTEAIPKSTSKTIIGTLSITEAGTYTVHICANNNGSIQEETSVGGKNNCTDSSPFTIVEAPAGLATDACSTLTPRATCQAQTGCQWFTALANSGGTSHCEAASSQAADDDAAWAALGARCQELGTAAVWDVEYGCSYGEGEPFMYTSLEDLEAAVAAATGGAGGVRCSTLTSNATCLAPSCQWVTVLASAGTSHCEAASNQTMSCNAYRANKDFCESATTINCRWVSSSCAAAPTGWAILKTKCQALTDATWDQSNGCTYGQGGPYTSSAALDEAVFHAACTRAGGVWNNATTKTCTIEGQVANNLDELNELIAIPTACTSLLQTACTARSSDCQWNPAEIGDDGDGNEIEITGPKCVTKPQNGTLTVNLTVPTGATTPTLTVGGTRSANIQSGQPASLPQGTYTIRGATITDYTTRWENTCTSGSVTIPSGGAVICSITFVKAGSTADGTTPTLTVSASGFPAAQSVKPDGNQFIATKLKFTTSGNVDISKITISAKTDITADAMPLADIESVQLFEGTNQLSSAPMPLTDGKAALAVTWAFRDTSPKDLLIKAKLKSTAATGKKFALGIKAAGDIEFKTGGGNATVSSTFPVMGNLITVGTETDAEKAAREAAAAAAAEAARQAAATAAMQSQINQLQQQLEQARASGSNLSNSQLDALNGQIALLASQINASNNKSAKATCEDLGQYTYTGPARPGVRMPGMCIDCPTTTYVRNGGQCEVTKTAEKPAKKTGTDKTAGTSLPEVLQSSSLQIQIDQLQQELAQTKAAQNGGQGQTAGAGQPASEQNQVGSAGQSSNGQRGAASEPTLTGSQRLVRAPDRSGTGPEVLVYFGILAIAQGAMIIRKKLKK